MRPMLFHGTRCSVTDSIKKEGLRLDCKRNFPYSDPDYYAAEPPQDDLCEPRAFRCGVYLTDIEREAYGWGLGVVGKDDKSNPPDPQKVCVVQVNEEKLPKGCKIGPDGFGHYMTNCAIPPQAIVGVLSRDEVCADNDLRCQIREQEAAYVWAIENKRFDIASGFSKEKYRLSKLDIERTYGKRA